MTFKAAKCPNCAGELQVPEERDSVKCMYCGSDIIVREAINLVGGMNIENLIALARMEEQTKNYQRAHEYYSTVLEHDAKNAEAWAGKGFTYLFIKEDKSEADDYAMKCVEKAFAYRGEVDLPTKSIEQISDILIIVGCRHLEFHEEVGIELFRKAANLSRDKNQTKQKIVRGIYSSFDKFNHGHMDIRFMSYPEFCSKITHIFDYLDEIDVEKKGGTLKKRMVSSIDITFKQSGKEMPAHLTALRTKLVNDASISQSGGKV